MPRIKLMQKGFEKYTGNIGPYKFENGVSEEVSIADAERIGGSMRVRLVDEKGEVTDENPGITQKMLDARGRKTEVVKPRVADKDKPEGEKEPEKEPEVTLDFDFTEESLGKLADEGGINAVREVANDYDVRGTSIAGLIKDLMAKKAAHEELTKD